MRAAGSVSLAMSSAQVLADEIPLTSREITPVDLLRRVYRNSQYYGQLLEGMKGTHGSTGGDIGVLPWNSFYHSLDADMGSSSLNPSGFSFFSFACPRERPYSSFRQRYRPLPSR